MGLGEVPNAYVSVAVAKPDGRHRVKATENRPATTAGDQPITVGARESDREHLGLVPQKTWENSLESNASSNACSMR